MDQQIEHPDGTTLAAYWAHPAKRGPVPGLVLCHDFPIPPRGAVASGLTFPELADRIAAQVGWRVLTFNFRGTGGSGGDFSIGGWNADLRLAVAMLLDHPDTVGASILGTGVGGTLALGVGATDPRIRGIACLGAPTNLSDWARNAGRFARHCRRMGVFSSDDAPRDVNAWAREMAAVDAVASARAFAPRPLLLLHGTDDDVVSVSESQRLAAAHGTAELRIIGNAGRRLRHDPRAVASVLGWLDRQAP
ncbi:MAG: prolyl oligopeptidase family serine peptidase [Acidimicrobiia bacterium]|nr:prolyl oligopeptidase family serine peptidase [Acidimicrobiia bacterium]